MSRVTEKSDYPANGHTNGRVNGHANGHSNGHASVHARNGRQESPERRPRVLFLSYRFPFPLIGGDRIKAYYLVQHLSSIAEVDLIALDEARSATPETIPELEALANVHLLPFDKRNATIRVAKSLVGNRPIEFAYYDDATMQAAVDQALATNKYDLIVCFFLRTAKFVRHLGGLNAHTPKLLVAEDARVILEERATERFSFFRGPGDQMQYIVRKIDAGRLRDYEPRAMAEGFERVTFVSKVDERRILAANAKLPTAILTNGVALDDFEFYAGEREDKIIFFGYLGTYHNIQMARRLLKHIYPKIREVSPRTKLVMVGKSPNKQLRKLIEHTPGAELHADVKDIRPYLHSAKILVHAQTVGAGIQNKLLEAMALGTPIVTTPVGASGIEGLEDNVHALVRTSDQAIIEATLSLLKNDDKALRLARNARQLVEDRYTWDRVFRSFNAIIRECAPHFFDYAGEPPEPTGFESPHTESVRWKVGT
ncbi:MAG TPA: glycosyltransferase [Candidatus Kapabacteria bacterium]|nr:glycosyltransferase [Candidatus Kapabacteria bacterium]